MAHEIDVKFYPGWTRKAMSFSIDDGYLEMDKKFMDIVEPYGFRGTFNLCSDRLSRMSSDEYRAFYNGHEITNHCKYHPRALEDGVEYNIATEPFNPETANRSYIYPTAISGVYHAPRAAGGWLKIADGDTYIKLIEDCHRELEEVFGKGSIRCFIWPYGQQKNKQVADYVKNIPGYYGERLSNAGASLEETFAPPTSAAFYSAARHFDILEKAEKYEALADDGELKFFCFGIHSVDYERGEKWDDLRAFAKKYGARPEDYYYAPICERYDYAEATNAIEIGEKEIFNPTPLDLYVKIDGVRKVIKAGRKLAIG